MIRGFAATISLIAVLVPAIAHAQTNLDQGKSAAQIFAADCAECHKAAHGLASGKSSASLTDFLREHYTTSREQAAALAAYVLAGRSGETGAAQGHGQKPALEHANAAPEEPKPAKNQAPHSTKREDGAPVTAKPQRPAAEAGKPEDEQPSVMAPIARPAAVARTHRKEPKTPPPEPPAAVAHAPAAAVADPAPSEAPRQEASPNPTPAAAAPADAASGESGESEPAPRDDVPD